jgi:hypothetical protein
MPQELQCNSDRNFYSENNNVSQVYTYITKIQKKKFKKRYYRLQDVPELAYQPLTTSSPFSSDENFTRNIFLKSIVYKLQQFYVSQS